MSKIAFAPQFGRSAMSRGGVAAGSASRQRAPVPPPHSSDRVDRVGDVEQDPVALARAGGEPDLRERGDVVALAAL
jgi:hypothetical protein